MLKKIHLVAFAALLLLGQGCAKPPATAPARAAKNALAPSASRNSAKTVQAAKTVILSFDADMTPAMIKKLDSGKIKAYYDQAIIDLLAKENIPARIFVTGLFAERYPALIRELAALPNITIGDHTYDHASFEPGCYGLATLKTAKEKIDEITKTQALLQQMTGRAPVYFRYPGSCRTAADDALVASVGLTIDNGNLTSGDAFNKSADKIVATVMAKVEDGSDILFHLGGPNAPATAVALPKIIVGLKDRGFGFAK